MGLVNVTLPSAITITHKLDPDTKAFLQSLVATATSPFATIQSQLAQLLTNTETIMGIEKDIQDEEQVIEGDVAALKLAAQANTQKLTDLGTQLSDAQKQIDALKAGGTDTTALQAALTGMQGIHMSLTDVTAALTPAPAPTQNTASGETQVGG